jgi:LemA protein
MTAMTATTATLAVVAALVLLLVVAVVVLRNGLVARRAAVEEARAQIDTQLRRRHDLVPELVRAVRGYLDYEREVFTRVAAARTAAVAATGGPAHETATAENALTAELRSLRALVESYPGLHGGAVVLRLQEDLTSTENRIAFARQHHADSVMRYNTAREELPASLVAGPLGFRPAEYLDLDLPATRRTDRA